MPIIVKCVNCGALEEHKRYNGKNKYCRKCREPMRRKAAKNYAEQHREEYNKYHREYERNKRLIKINKSVNKSNKQESKLGARSNGNI